MPLPEALAQARNHYGPLHPRSVEAIWKFMFDPSIENWDKIYGIMINPKCPDKRIVWEAVASIDPTCPRHMRASPDDPLKTATDRWSHAPNRFIVARAIQESTECRKEPDERQDV